VNYDGQVATIPVVASQPRDGTQAIWRLVPSAIPSSRTHRIVDSRLKVVGRQLTLKGVKMATDIVQAYNSSTQVESLLREYDTKFSVVGGKAAAQVTPDTGLEEWKSVYLKFEHTILNIQNLAIRSAALISDFLDACLPSRNTVDYEAFRVFQGKKTILDLRSKTEEVMTEMEAVIERMKDFKLRFRDESNPTINKTLAFIDIAIDKLSQVFGPISRLTSKQTSLLDNTTAPGLMRSVVFLLPPEHAARVTEVIDGKRSTAEDLERAEDIEQSSNSSSFVALFAVSNTIQEDVSAALDSVVESEGSNSRRGMWGYSVNSAYGLLETALKEFEHSLKNGMKNEYSGVRRARRRFLRKVFRCFFPCFGFTV